MTAMPQVAVGCEGWYGGRHPVAALVLPAGRNLLAPCEFIKPIPALHPTPPEGHCE